MHDIPAVHLILWVYMKTRIGVQGSSRSWKRHRVYPKVWGPVRPAAGSPKSPRKIDPVGQAGGAHTLTSPFLIGNALTQATALSGRPIRRAPWIIVQPVVVQANLLNSCDLPSQIFLSSSHPCIFHPALHGTPACKACATSRNRTEDGVDQAKACCLFGGCRGELLLMAHACQSRSTCRTPPLPWRGA